MGIQTRNIFFKKITLISLFTLLLIGTLFAQFPGSNRGGGRGGNPFSGGGRSGGQSLTSEKDASRDTLNEDVFIYYADNAEEKKKFADSSFINFHIYDPTRQAKYEHAHLGNLGSAHRQLVYQPRFHKGFDAGFHQYDLYLTRPKDIPYYQLEKDYSDIYFDQTNQQKTALKLRFSKPILNNAYLGINYNNIRNTGVYDNQFARVNSFTTTLNFKSEKQKYRGYFSFTTNTVEQKENGGALTSDENFRKSLVAVGRPVNTDSGESRYSERDINYTQFYLLQKTPKLPPTTTTKEDSLRTLVTKPIENQKDTTGIKDKQAPPIPKPRKTGPSGGRGKGSQGRPMPPSPTPSPSVPEIPQTGRKFTLKHNFSLRRNTYKYVDESNLSYYGNFVNDDRAVRSFIRTNQVENTFSIRTFRLAEGTQTSVFGTKKEETPIQKDLLEVGATHLYTNLYQEPKDSTINNVFLFGKLDFTPSERLKINTYAHLGMLKQIGDYYIKGDILWDTKKLGRLKLGLVNQLYTPSLVQQQFIVTQGIPTWQNDFKKTSETTLSASYSISKLKTDLTFNNHTIDNLIYFDTIANPVQLGAVTNISQLIINNQIDVSFVHLQNTIYLQKSTQDKIRFPEFYSIHRLWLDLKLFKVMESQLGGEIRLNSPYKPDNYSPLTGQFHLQDEFRTTSTSGIRSEIPLYPLVDIFFNFRIKQFRFFLVYENALHNLRGVPFHYTTYPYPVFDSQMRMGFRWLFLD